MRHKIVGAVALLALLLIACGSDPIEEPGAEVEGIFVEPTQLELAAGESAPLQTTVTGFGNRNVLYSSSAPRIATVNAEGLVTALRPGIVGITATSEAEPSLFVISLITVTGTSPLATITSFTASPPTIEVGDTATLSWEVLGEDVEVSLQPDVGDLGNVTSIEVSPLETTTYTLTASNGAGSDQVSVTVRVVNTIAPIAPDMCEGDYLVNSQFELATLTTCRVITGTLTIDQSDDIVDLMALANLEQVDNLNVLKNDALISLAGLENLMTVTNDLIIGEQQDIVGLSAVEQKPFLGNNLLESLQGLNNLERVGGDLAIGFNDALISLAGLESLKTVGGRLDIFESLSLTSLAGLSALTSVEGNIFIYDNAALETLTGLNAIIEVGDRLEIFRNNALMSLTGLESLGAIGGGFLVSFNETLASLDGLDNIQSIGGDLLINFNFSLTSLSAIASLTDEDIGGQARIFDNGSLDCAAQSLQFTVVGICN
jgi:hypothetical protein